MTEPAIAHHVFTSSFEMSPDSVRRRRGASCGEVDGSVTAGSAGAAALGTNQPPLACAPAHTAAVWVADAAALAVAMAAPPGVTTGAPPAPDTRGVIPSAVSRAMARSAARSTSLFPFMFTRDNSAAERPASACLRMAASLPKERSRVCMELQVDRRASPERRSWRAINRSESSARLSRQSRLASIADAKRSMNGCGATRAAAHPAKAILDTRG